ncbi:MAG: (d)CMP kinase [Alphaproteobacteria bacterium]|nr:(d)CMP kinase [Alphaproteobacteria bacterium]
MKELAIALDGPGSAGKGTIARGVARTLGYQYVDTGAMYRAVALRALRAGISWDAHAELAELAASLVFEFPFDGDVLRVIVDGEDLTSAIRSDEIGMGASMVSKVPAVRQALLGLQRDLGARGGIVMDGRDIGTVVLPDAALKVYVDADLEVRSLRRYEELLRRGQPASLASVRTALAARDRQDMERSVAPLKAAADAITLDTTEMTVRQAIEAVVKLARARRGA